MLKRRLFYLAAAFFLVPALFFRQLPTLLKAMPSRYVARLPEPLQVLGARGDGVPILPTVSVPVTAAALLQAPVLPAATAVVEPPTPDAFLWFNLGTVYNATGAYENAATAFDQARAIGLPWRMLWYQFGPYEAYYQVGRTDDIIMLADVTLKDRPYFEESYYYKGLALLAQGDADAARDNFERAANFNPLFQPAVNALQQFGN